MAATITIGCKIILHSAVSHGHYNWAGLQPFAEAKADFLNCKWEFKCLSHTKSWIKLCWCEFTKLSNLPVGRICRRISQVITVRLARVGRKGQIYGWNDDFISHQNTFLFSENAVIFHLCPGFWRYESFDISNHFVWSGLAWRMSAAKSHTSTTDFLLDSSFYWFNFETCTKPN